MRQLRLISSTALCLVTLCACAPYGKQTDTRYATRPSYADSQNYADNSRPSHQSRARRAQEGRVSSIERLNAQSSGGGAVLGAVLGGVLGHQVGKGSGRSVATGVGAIGGALVGNQMEQNNAAQVGYRVFVVFDDGRREQFDYENLGDLQTGDRVRVERGQMTRI